MRRKDGSEQWVSTNVHAFRNDDGQILFYEGTMRDIAHRKEMEKALAESEERYRTVIERSNDGIAFARGSMYEYVNSRFVSMFGYDSPEDIVSKPVTFIVHPDDRQMVADIHARRSKGQPVPPRYEFRGITRTGATIYVDVSTAEVAYRNEPVLIVFLRDVSERKRAEEVFLQSHRQLEQLNRAKTKAINHISHELRTPLSVIQGITRILRRRLEGTTFATQTAPMFETVEKHLARLFRIQNEGDQILRTSREVETVGLLHQIDQVKERLGDLPELPVEIAASCDKVREWVGGLPPAIESYQLINLEPFLEKSVQKAKQLAVNRRLAVRTEGASFVQVVMAPDVLRGVVDGLIRNAIENTPDGGMVTVTTEERGDHVFLHVTDTGIGITEEDQQYIFDGLFHAKDTELYTSREPYDFGAGGKGLDLLRMKVYAGRFGFGLSVKSTRCSHLLGEGDVCPGEVSRCPFCTTVKDCVESSGTTFTIFFRKSRGRPNPVSD
jgi:PAS domain S-box-containing protein